MAQPLNERTRKLSKIGGTSYMVTLPIEFVRALEWRDGQKINIRMDKDKLVIEDWKK